MDISNTKTGKLLVANLDAAINEIKARQNKPMDMPIEPSYILLSDIILRRLKEEWAILHPDKPFSLAKMIDAIRGE